MLRWILAGSAVVILVLVLVVNRATKYYGPVELGAHVEVTHGFYTGCDGEVVETDPHGSFWIDAWCDGENRGRLLFTKDFLRRIK